MRIMIVMTFYRSRIPNARRYLNGMTRICYGSGLLIAALIYVLPVSGQAQQTGIYDVAGIQVDRTADTAATARQEAIVEASESGNRNEPCIPGVYDDSLEVVEAEKKQFPQDIEVSKQCR